MLHVNKIRNTEHKIIALGFHPGILQSMLDFDYLAGKSEPSLKGIIATGRRYVRLFLGEHETLIPVYPTANAVPDEIKKQITLFVNLSSARRTLSSTLEAMEVFPNVMAGTLFAENVTEKHSIELYQNVQTSTIQSIIGPASVGLLIPGHLKLGAIGGTQAKQLADSHLFEPGNVAVFSSSGGMTNELIRLTTQLGKRLSFSLSFGGDRFPVCTPVEAFLAAEADPQTDTIIYFGELGGYDEYELAKLIKKKKITKKVIAYIAGTISEMFETPPQFGHAKAMAARGEETAQAKAKALKSAGAAVTNSFTEFMELVKKIKPARSFSAGRRVVRDDMATQLEKIQNRKPSLFMNSVSTDKDEKVEIVGQDLLSLVKTKSYGYIVSSMLLGRPVKSKELAEASEFILKLLVDHGPYVSGAVNTMISARAGKDLVSSLVSGLLTIGPRFGGAINQAANHWFEGVTQKIEPSEYVEQIAAQKKFISGIGHRKYRIDFPDPRVKEILAFTNGLKTRLFTDFALKVQKITTGKKGNLILNVDGAIAAVLMDILSEKEGLSHRELQELIDTEFFNAYFVLSRAVGFTAHYLDQRRLDEGLFRLSPNEVSYATIPKSSK